MKFDTTEIDMMNTMTKAEMCISLIGYEILLSSVSIIMERIAGKYDDHDVDKVVNLLRDYTKLPIKDEEQTS